jgi:drug/metabolite transporter (DMT)-like permease
LSLPERQAFFMESKQKQAILYALGAVLAWSTVSTAFKLSLRHMTPLGLLLGSALSATLFLFVLNLIRSKAFSWNRLAVNLAKSTPAGALNPFVYYLMLFVAYDRLRAQEAQVLNYTWAIVLSLLSVLILKQRFRLKDLAALCLSFFGVVLISTQGQLLQLKFDDPLGSALAVSTSFVWGAYWILNMKDPRPAREKLLYNFAIGTLLTAAYALLSSKLNPAGLLTPNGKPLLAILGAIYIGIFEMGFTFILWQKALDASENTASVSNLIFITPFISLLFIALVLKEPVHPATLAGLVVIVGSNLWQRRARG